MTVLAINETTDGSDVHIIDESNVHQLLVICDVIVQDKDDCGGSIVQGVRDRNNVTDITIGSGQSGTADKKIVGAGDVISSHGLDGDVIVQDENDSGGSIVEGARERNNVRDITIGSSQSETTTNTIVGAGDVTSSNSSELNLKELHKQVKKLPPIKYPNSTRSEA